MSVGAVGGMGAGAGMGAAGIGGAGAMSVGAAPASGAVPGAQTGAPGNIQNLANSMKDFSSAEILIALMLAKALNGGGDDEKSSGAAGFLAGLALAGGLGQGGAPNIELNAGLSGVPEIGGAGAGGGAGLSLNVSV